MVFDFGLSFFGDWEIALDVGVDALPILEFLGQGSLLDLVVGRRLIPQVDLLHEVELVRDFLGLLLFLLLFLLDLLAC